MRILFHGPSVSSTRPITDISCKTGINAAKFVRSINDLRLAFNLTGNTGNIIHAEAPLKLFDYDLSRSAIIDIHKLYSKFKNRTSFNNKIKDNFDCIIFSLANLIRPDFNTNLHEILEDLPIRFYVFGVGLQNEIKYTALKPNTKRLLDILNSKSALFGVRGSRTEKWLHENGFHNAVALGCPSLYVYPEMIMKNMSLNKPIKNVLTAGHLSDHYISKKSENRVEIIKKIQESFPSVSYIYQDEPFTYGELIEEENIWKESISQFDKEIFNSYLSIKLNHRIDFQNHYLFFSSDTWRIVCTKYDLFIGDRLHAGIAALQSGIPSIILYNDMRVKDLAEYHKFPSLSVHELLNNDINLCIDKALSNHSMQAFLDKYKERYIYFSKIIHESGLKLKNKWEFNRCIKNNHNYDSNVSINNKAEYLLNVLTLDAAKTIYAQYLEDEFDQEIAWEFLSKYIDDINQYSVYFRLFIIEKSLLYKKNIDIYYILSNIHFKNLSRSEYKKISSILYNTSNPAHIGLDNIYHILQSNHPDIFDACISLMIKLEQNDQAIEYLKLKIENGNGTRKRVNQILTLLIKKQELNKARDILRKYYYFLSKDKVDHFKHILNINI